MNDGSISTGRTVWEDLLTANKRFAAGESKHPHSDMATREKLRGGQSPRVAVLACSDSRVPVETIFDQGLGDIFVIRTAGETLDPAVLASLEYAVVGLNVDLLLVLGHESCGAVGAGLAVLDEGKTYEGNLRVLAEQTMPSIAAARAQGLTEKADYERIHALNAAQQIPLLSMAIQRALDEGKLEVMAAYYSQATGLVEQVGTVAS